MDTSDCVVALGFLAFLSFLAFMVMQRPVNNTVQPTYVQLPPSLGGR